MPLLYAILLALGMLLIGGAAGWGITYWLNSSKETPVQPAPPQPTPAQTTPAQSVPVQPAPVQLVPNQPAPAEPAATSEPANQSIGSSQANTIATADNQNDIAAEYNKKLAHIKTLDFKFNEIAGLKQFLNNQEAKNIEKNKLVKDRLSYHVDVAEKVYKAISFANSSAESIKKAVGSYAATSNTNLDQKIRAAICASYSGDYRDANKKTPYSRSQSNRAVESARNCKSYQDLYYIPDLVLSDKED